MFDNQGLITDDVIKDFWSFVNKRSNDRCWLWQGKINTGGYGNFKLGSKYVAAHRFSYFISKGYIEGGMEIHHTCKCTFCVNPKHLVKLTVKEHGKTRKGSQW